jgi:hypothetical protein
MRAQTCVRVEVSLPFLSGFNLNQNLSIYLIEFRQNKIKLKLIQWFCEMFRAQRPIVRTLQVPHRFQTRLKL